MPYKLKQHALHMYALNEIFDEVQKCNCEYPGSV